MNSTIVPLPTSRLQSTTLLRTTNTFEPTSTQISTWTTFSSTLNPTSLVKTVVVTKNVIETTTNVVSVFESVVTITSYATSTSSELTSPSVVPSTVTSVVGNSSIPNKTLSSGAIVAIILASSVLLICVAIYLGKKLRSWRRSRNENNENPFYGGIYDEYRDVSSVQWSLQSAGSSYQSSDLYGTNHRNDALATKSDNSSSIFGSTSSIINDEMPVFCPHYHRQSLSGCAHHDNNVY